MPELTHRGAPLPRPSHRGSPVRGLHVGVFPFVDVSMALRCGRESAGLDILSVGREGDVVSMLAFSSFLLAW